MLHRTFPLPGDYVVGLKVTDKEGAFGSEFREIHVRSASTGPPISLRLLNPFPIIRITGRVTKAGAHIRRLTAQAPIGAQVTVRCRGAAARSRPPPDSPAGPRRVVHVHHGDGALPQDGAPAAARRLEGHGLGHSPGLEMGKYTQWTIRKSKPPKRRDLCLTPGAPSPAACPSS